MIALAMPRNRRRRRLIRPKSIIVKRLTRANILRGMAMYPEKDYWRPKSLSDCAQIEHPCPYVACKYNLYLDVQPATGSIKVNFPDLEPDEMRESCAMRLIATMGPMTLEEIGDAMNLTRERIRQIEIEALEKARIACEELGFAAGDLGFVDGSGVKSSTAVSRVQETQKTETILARQISAACDVILDQYENRRTIGGTVRKKRSRQMEASPQVEGMPPAQRGHMPLPPSLEPHRVKLTGKEIIK